MLEFLCGLCLSVTTLIRAIPQPHITQVSRPNLLNMLNGLDQMRHKLSRVLCGGEMAEIRHGLVHGAGNLVGRLLRHLGCVGPVVLARQHVDGAALRIDGGDARAAVPAAKVEVEVAVEDLFCWWLDGDVARIR